MLFNSIDFAIFLPIVFALYWSVVRFSPRFRNVVLLVASYVFYGWWDWRFLSLIVLSSTIDYCVGRGLAHTDCERRRRSLLMVSVFANIGFLGFFKYYSFFLANFLAAFSFLGQPISAHGLNIVLPVGISFYTFQTLSYSIDVYRRKIEPTTNILAFFSFVSFFPQLVAGPIERATHLLPQFYEPKPFVYDDAINGLRQMLWGLFKKVVVADNCARFVNETFINHADCSGSTLLLGVFCFAFQIYGDFSGYSDIAIGTSRLFGFSLKDNFAFPYFSRDIAEFWRRWHISLSSWFRDYVYIPLGGSRGGTWQQLRNVLVIFSVSGLWHGANWTFVVWGVLNALYFIPLLLLNKNRRYTDLVAKGRLLPSLREAGQIVTTFSLTLVAWVFFRADSLGHAVDYLYGMFSASLFSLPPDIPGKPLAFIALTVGVEWLQRDRKHGLDFSDRKLPRPVRWMIYYAVLTVILWFGGAQQEFIYFQF